VFGSSVTAGGITAIIATLVIGKPEDIEDIPNTHLKEHDVTTPATAAI